MESSEVCQTGLAEEAELYWKDEQEAALAPCLKLKHVLQRTARDSPDVRFVTLEVRWGQECGEVTTIQNWRISGPGLSCWQSAWS